MVIIGEEGLEKGTLIIAQNASRIFDITHEDAEGNVIDHSQSTAKMAVQSKKGHWQMDECVTCAADKIRVSIPPSVTKEIPAGKHNWDIFVTTSQGEQIRLVFGEAKVCDTYAMDEVE